MEFDSDSKGEQLDLVDGNVQRLESAVYVSQSAISDETGMARRTVAKRLSALDVEPAASRNGYPVWRLRDVLPLFLGSSPTTPDDLQPHQRQAHYKAELDRLKLEERQSELIARPDAAAEFARLQHLLLHALEQLPGNITARCGLDDDALAVLTKACREVSGRLQSDAIDYGSALAEPDQHR